MGLWGDRAARVIRQVLDSLPVGASPAERRKAVSAAYPFGERAMHPYKAWLREVRKALGPQSGRKPPSVTLDPEGVICTWRKACGGCIACADARRRHAALTPQDIATWRALAEDARGDSQAAAILADWLSEHNLTPGD